MFRPLQIELIVEDYLRGSRVDTFLGKHLRNYSAWRIQRIIQNGGVTIDGRAIELSERLYHGQRLTVRLLEPPDHLITPETTDLEILFEDPWILVVNKPAGVICHPVGDYQTGTLCHAVQAHLDRHSISRGMMRPGIVHRLDRQTSLVQIPLVDQQHQIFLPVAEQQIFHSSLQQPAVQFFDVPGVPAIIPDQSCQLHGCVRCGRVLCP